VRLKIARASVVSAAVRMGFFFGPWKLDPRELFFLRYGVMAFVNYKPVVPGHILIAPVRVVDKFTATSDDELVEMWKLARRIGGLMEGTLYAGSVSAVTYVIQDGADAGQTVPHVHIHVLPRRKGDFARNDEM